MPRFIFEVQVVMDEEFCPTVHERLQVALDNAGEWGDGFEALVLGGARSPNPAVRRTTQATPR